MLLPCNVGRVTHASEGRARHLGRTTGAAETPEPARTSLYPGTLDKPVGSRRRPGKPRVDMTESQRCWQKRSAAAQGASAFAEGCTLADLAEVPIAWWTVRSAHWDVRGMLRGAEQGTEEAVVRLA
jgi:hypothetical protein